jgi:hypothetical protein
MIEIEQIVINGMSSGGAFAGVLKLDPGLQIISGGNHYGKSLTAYSDCLVSCCRAYVWHLRQSAHLLSGGRAREIGLW